MQICIYTYVYIFILMYIYVYIQRKHCAGYQYITPFLDIQVQVVPTLSARVQAHCQEILMFVFVNRFITPIYIYRDDATLSISITIYI